MDWYNVMYFGSEFVLSIATLVVLLRIGKALRNVVDIVHIYRQYMPGGDVLRGPRE